MESEPRDERFTSHGIAILGIQSLIDFIEEIERCWITFLYGEYQRQCHQRFLTAGQLLHVAHFVRFAVERHFDAHAGEVIDRHLLAGALRGHLFAIVVLAERQRRRIPAVDDGATRTSLSPFLITK